MAKQLKKIRAGLLNYEYLVPVLPEEGGRRSRRGRQAPSSQAQQFMNQKNSWRSLELKAAANFGSGDLVLTYTYDDAHLPPDKKAGGVLFQKYIRRLRKARRRRGTDLKYIFVTEGFHERRSGQPFGDDGSLEDRRIHHHVILNGTGPGDYEELRSLWEYGGYLRVEPLDVHYYRELAKYLTKEAREFGQPKPGEKAWHASQHLCEPEVEYFDIPTDSMTLAPPPGAVDYESFGERNPYGYAAFVGARYLLYPEAPNPDYSYTRGRSRDRALRHLKT